MTRGHPSAGDRAPRLSVIVSNYNYGHFLGPCLDSLAAQTSPPDEIIVVDDGSTDGSRALLESREGLTVILQENAGQAAAFNAGFAASSGEAVLFLDADDLLYPHAVETIRTLWAQGTAGLAWRLDTVDAQGAKIGRYPMRVPDADMLPRLMDGLQFPFMPTSGNVFAREAIDWAFPLPAPAWRISADALLLRAAVLSGPMRPVAQVLGAYRVHGENNYHRIGAAQTTNVHRGLLHIAEAGLALIAMARRAGRIGGDGAHAKLIAGTIRTRLGVERIAPDEAGLAAFLARMPEASQGGGWRLRLMAWLAARILRRSAAARRWAAEPAARPRWVQAVIEALAGAALVRARYAPVAARAPFDVPPAGMATRAELPVADLMAGPAWERNWSDGGTILRAPRGDFTLLRAPGGFASLELEVGSRNGQGFSVSVACNGVPVASEWVHGAARIVAPLPPPEPGRWGPDRITVAVEEPARPGLRARLRRQTGRLSVVRAVLVGTSGLRTDGVLPVQDERPFAELGDAVRRLAGDGAETMGSGDRLCLALPALPPPYALAMRFADGQAPGRLLLAAGGRTLFSGEIDAMQRIAVPVPEDMARGDRIEITAGFRPEVFLDGDAIAPAALGWIPGAVADAHGGAVLSPGERAGAGTGRSLAPFLGEGWERDGTGAAVMVGPSAELRVEALGREAGARLRLDLEPLDPFADETAPVVIASAGETERTVVRLGGRATVELDLSPGSMADERESVTILAAAPGVDGTADADHGGIVLHGIALEPVEAALPGAAASPDDAGAPDLVRRLAALRDAAETGRGAGEAAAIRAALERCLVQLAPGAAWHLIGPEDLTRLADLGADLGPSEGTLPAWEAGDWLRTFALAALAGPVSPGLASLSLGAIPHLPEPMARAVAAVVMRDPGPGSPREVLLRHQDLLVARLEEAREILASAPVVSAPWVLARAVVQATSPRGLLFSDLDLKPHVVAYARALETLLTRTGHVLPLLGRDGESPGPRARIGIVLRSAEEVPETWIARGITAALPSWQADVTVFLTQSGAGPEAPIGDARVVPLAGRRVADIVATVRAARLDTVILGAAFHGHMPDAELAAHRMAPRQVALAAAHYATTGFRSVDEMIFGALQAPQAAQDDCSERPVVGPGTGQLFGFGPARATVPEARGAMRSRLGVADHEVLLASGAMADKIGPDLLATWAGILAERPEAKLALYPFAANWLRDYDEEAFDRAVRTACAARGVDRGRVMVLPPLGAEGVAEILSAADVFLASFPYSGATTTLEALRAAVPVVAHAEPTQRGHQAAGWLEAFGLGRLVATSPSDYIRIAAELVASAEARETVREEIRAREAEAVAQAPFRDWLRDHLLGGKAVPEEEVRYLFHHIPKTGGTSLRRVLGKWFEIAADYRKPWGDFSPDRVDIEALGPGQIVAGHYWAPEMPLFSRYPETLGSSKWRVICFVRDPLERALSEYFFQRAKRPEHDHGFRSETLASYLSGQNNYLLSHFDATEANWRDALDRYWFIGTLERFDACVDYLGRAMGKPVPATLPVENVTARGEEPDPEAVAAFRANNEADYAIYAEVNRRLDRLLGSRAGE